MMIIMRQYETLLENMVNLAILAGTEILKIYQRDQNDIKVTSKKDQSPITEADISSHKIITQGLQALTPQVPILSEESIIADFSQRKTWHIYWLIDPLDGTKEFINHNDEFTVNIALIENHRPVLGVVFVPAKDICYYAGINLGAYKITNNIKVAIHTREKENTIVVAVSHDEKSGQLHKFLQSIGPYTLIRMGSSIKICLIAEGQADLYVRLFPTSEWDTAAAQCILSEAGGNIYDVDQHIPLQYNTKDSLLNPHFLALSESNKYWLDLFPSRE